MRARLVLLASVALASGCQSWADLDAKLPFDCSDAGCPTGLRCNSQSLRCFDPAVTPTTNGACSGYDAGNVDCATGWLCAVESPADSPGVCVDMAALDGGPCFDDTLCATAANWRCDLVERRCKEVTDTLTPRGGTLSAEKRSPLLDDPLPELAATGESYPRFQWNPQRQLDARFWATWSSVGLKVFANIETLDERDGGFVVVTQRHFPTAPRPRAMSMLGDAVVTLEQSGNLVLYPLDGGLMPLTVSGDIEAIATFTPDAGVEDTRVVAIGRSGASFYFRDGHSEPIDGGVGPAGGYTAVAGLFQSGSGVIFGFDGGLGIRDPSGQWLFDALPGPPELGGAGAFSSRYLIRDFHFALRNRERTPVLLELERRGPDAGIDLLLLDIGQRSCCPATLPVQVVEGPSAACPCDVAPDQVWMVAERSSSEPQPIYTRCPAARCAEVPGGPAVDYPARSWRVKLGHGQGQRSSFNLTYEDDRPYQRGLPIKQTGRNGRAIAGAHGQLWVADDVMPDPDGAYPLRAVLLDQPAAAMFSLNVKNLQLEGDFAATGTLLYRFLAGFGYVSENRSPRGESVEFVGTVPQHSTWIVMPRALYDGSVFPGGGELPRVVAQLPAFAVDLTAPVNGALIGNDYLLLTSGDTLYTAEVPPGDYDPPATLTPRLVPAPGLPIRSLVARFTGGGGIEGYALTGQGLMRLESRDLQRWSATPTSTVPGEVPERLWLDGAGAFRLGYRSGLVTPAENSVPLTQVADGGPDFTQYVRLCQETVGVGDGALYRLAAGDGRPVWRAEPVPILTGVDLRGAAFSEGDDGAWLTTAAGEVFELTLPGQGGCR